MKKSSAKIFIVFFIVILICNAGYAQNSNSGSRQKITSGASEDAHGNSREILIDENGVFSFIDDGDQVRRDSKRGQSSFEEDIRDMRDRESRENRPNMGLRGSGGLRH